jgi:hypothetical protein
VPPTLILAKTDINERRLYITKLLHRSTPSNSKVKGTNPPTTRSARQLDPTSNMNQSRIWLPSQDSMADPTISVHQVSPLQQTLQTPDHQDTSSSKRCNISNRTTPMPSRSITHHTRAMRHLNLDQLSTVRGEALGRVIFLNIIMELFLKHEANGHLPCPGILHTGRSIDHIHRMARKRIVSPEPRHSPKCRPIPIRPDQSQRPHPHVNTFTPIPDYYFNDRNTSYPILTTYIHTFQISNIEPQASNHVQHQ